jgi:hypothetical protein
VKISFYFDVWPWTRAADIIAWSAPNSKLEGATRYRVDVEIPDPESPDVVLQGEAVEEP